jgi:hypothetical protein
MLSPKSIGIKQSNLVAIMENPMDIDLMIIAILSIG